MAMAKRNVRQQNAIKGKMMQESLTGQDTMQMTLVEMKCNGMECGGMNTIRSDPSKAIREQSGYRSTSANYAAAKVVLEKGWTR